MNRTILHCDMNSFYASVEVLYYTGLRNKAVAVCGSVEDRHGIVLAANPNAKKFGIRTGDAVWQAKAKCGDLVVVEPHMDRYVRFSRMAREVYSEYSPCVEAYGLDENWLDVTGTEYQFGNGAGVADAIRDRIHRELGVTISVGASFNKSMAKLGSDYKKPNATTVITKENFKQIVWPLPVSDLLFVGPATTNMLNRIGIFTIGDLAKTPDDIIRRRLGKHGSLVWQYANGIDNAPVSETGTISVPKTIGNSTTASRDLVTPEDIRVTTMMLAESVAERLRKDSFRCQLVQVYIRYNTLDSCQRQRRLPFPSCTAQRIGDTATDLILKNWSGEPLRSIGVRAGDLLQNEYQQLSLLPELRKEQQQEDLEMAIQDVRRRFGHFAVQRGIMLSDRCLSDIDTQQEDSAQSVAFFRG